MQPNEPIVNKNPRPSNVEVKRSPPKSLRTEVGGFDVNSLVRDPGLRMSIGNYSVTAYDEVQRAYISFGPYQHYQDVYASSGLENHPLLILVSLVKKGYLG